MNGFYLQFTYSKNRFESLNFNNNETCFICYDKGGKTLNKDGNTSLNLEIVTHFLSNLGDNYIIKQSKSHVESKLKNWTIFFKESIKTFVIHPQQDDTFFITIYSINNSMNLFMDKKNGTISLWCVPLQIQYQMHENRLCSYKTWTNVSSTFLKYYLQYVNRDIRESPLFFGLYSEKVIKARLKRENPDNLIQFINSLEGYKLIITNSQHQTNGKSLHITPNTIKYMLWMDIAAGSIYKAFNYIEIDCSFRLFKDYVYCIFHAVLFNVSVPLGYIIGPSETEELYSLFFRKFKEIYNIEENKPFLGDQGSSIEAFVKNNSLEKYDCHRHIIEKVGANSILGCLVAKILRIPSELAYQTERNLLKEEIQRLVEDNPHITNLKGFEEILVMLDLYYMKDIRKIGDSPFPSDKKRWALWLRGPVATASNHSEGTHGLINRKFSRPLKFLNSLKILHETIKSRKCNYERNRIANIKANIERLNKKRKKLKLESLSKCSCAYGDIISHRLGTQHICVNVVNDSFTPQLSKVSNQWMKANDVPNQELKIEHDETVSKTSKITRNEYLPEVNLDLEGNMIFIEKDLEITLSTTTVPPKFFKRKNNFFLPQNQLDALNYFNTHKNAVLQRAFLRIQSDLNFFHINSLSFAFITARVFAALDIYHNEINDHILSQCWMLSMKLSKIQPENYEEVIHDFLNKYQNKDLKQ